MKEHTAQHTPPLISVVMSVYNGERFLRDAIDSILSQTYRNFEFIIINDGSSDKTVEIIESYTDQRIRLVNQTNQGLVKSLNKGISISRGVYIARMDADDISLPTRLEKEVLWLSQDSNRGMVSTYFAHINFSDGVPTGTTLVFPIGLIDLKRAFYLTNPFPHGASMYSKAVVEELGGYTDDYGPTEDYELWRRIAKRYEVGLIPEVLYWYRINNPGSISQQKVDIQNKFVQKIRDELWAEPFLRKSLRATLSDYESISTQVPNTYRLQAEAEYKSEQFTLAKELFLRQKLKQGIPQLVNSFALMPYTSLKLLPFLQRCTINRIRHSIHKRRIR